MSSKMQWTHPLLTFAVATVFLVSIAQMSAQVQTQTSTTSGASTVATSVERGEVVYVQGNTLVVKMEDGTLRDFRNVSESARIMVNGKELGIHDLKVGMKLEKTVTTTTTPQTITTVQTVTGRVRDVTPPKSVMLTLEDGTNQRFTIPKDQKFNVDGQMVDAWGLKKGMKVSATKVVEESANSVHLQSQVSGSMPPPSPPPPDQPILIAVAPPPPSPTAEVAPAPPRRPAELPKTASMLPLIGLLGISSLLLSLGLRIVRRFRYE